jgi:hypothetical protein
MLFAGIGPNIVHPCYSQMAERLRLADMKPEPCVKNVTIENLRLAATLGTLNTSLAAGCFDLFAARGQARNNYE